MTRLADTAVSEPLLVRLSDFLDTHTGLHLPRERWGDLRRGLAGAARDFGLPDAQTCAHWLLTVPLTRAQIEVLASHLTVGETYFFREQPAFDALGERILPALIEAGRAGERRLRIWSAGCCTGEEPYSIAILLERLLPDIAEWNVTILATDINPLFLRKAAEGIYGVWSFRGTPDWVRERYFTRRRDGRFELHPRVRKRVVLSYLNLAEDLYPSLASNTTAMDLVFCRNVLMYFRPERARRVAANLYRALVNGGWLIVSPTETSHVTFADFAPVEFPGTVLYRKDAESAPRAAFIRPPAPEIAPAPLAWLPEPPPVALPVEAAHPPPDRPAVAPDTAPPAADDTPASPARAARDCANAGRLAEAVEWCERAIAADKLDPAHHYLLATVEQERGRIEAAVQSLQRALYLDPGFVLAHFALGNLYRVQDRPREAERHLGNALALARKHPPGEVLPESDGLTAGRLGEIVGTVLASLPQAMTPGV